jgi:hypothetical protein
MNKTPTPKSEQVETAESTQHSVYDDLLKNGTAILEASTREDLAELVNLIPAECKYMAGAVGFNPETGAFSLRVDINP